MKIVFLNNHKKKVD